MHVTVTIPDEHYLRSCARIRDISVRALVTRLLEAIAEDQLVPGILDDDAVRVRRKREWKYRESPYFAPDEPDEDCA